MAKYILYFIIPGFLFSCGGDDNQSKNSEDEEYQEFELYDDPDNMVEETDEDTTSFFTFIKPKLSSDPYDLLVTIRDLFNEVETEEDLASLYDNYVFDGLAILNELMQEEEGYDYELGPENELWYKLTDEIPFYDMERSCSECSFEVLVNAYPLLELAKKTEGENDDLFFKAINYYYNGKEYADQEFIPVEAGNNYAFYTLSCDFCSESLLGTGVFYDVLSLTQNCTDTSNIFAENLYQLEERALNYLNQSCFTSSQEEVLTELEKIAEKVKMPEKHMQSIYSQIDRVDSGDGLTFDGECEFDY